jgi:hypothetical protein
MRVGTANGVRHPFLIAAMAAALTGGACQLDKSQPQQLAGPSETGLSAEMTALPDLVNADGVSRAVVDMILRDASGKPVSGRAVLFCTTPTIPAAPLGSPPPDITTASCDSSTSAPQGFGNPGTLNPLSGFSQYVGPVQSGIVMATNSDGATRVYWVAGTDHNTTIVIGVRVYGLGDASRGFLQTVQIFQQ